MRDRRLDGDNEVICAIGGYLGPQTVDFFREEVAKFKNRWSKCGGTMLKINLETICR